MKRSREEKKARLLAKAEEMIEAYIEWGESHPKPKLTQIEDIILHLRKELGQEMAQMLLEEQEEKLPVPGPKCPQCGEEMRYKGQKDNQVESRVGLLEIERGYYHCPTCRGGLFPPGSAVGTAGETLERASGQASGEVERTDGL